MYRNDIDGLRAVAVLPVLFFHFGWDSFSGGYVGVDIFFVLSGYLITGILATEITAEKFSIIRFYERRLRRIFPALFVVIAVTCVFGYIIMLPQELKDLGQSVVATTLFSSNILFWFEAGYFDAESLSKPLLHTWSLAIEEQYYLFFPFLLFLIFRLTNAYRLFILMILWLLSLSCAVWFVNYNSSAGFFLPLGRVWELLTGSILALMSVRPSRFQYADQVIALVGLFSIFAAIAFYDHNTPFPGLAALAPCIGTAMIIYAGRLTPPLINQWLSTRPLIIVGLLSYSLYLWHWPLYVFASLYLDRPLGNSDIILLLTVTFFCAWLSWRFIERPFRGSASQISSRQVFIGSGVLITVFASWGTWLHISNGMPSRLTPETLALIKPMNSYHSQLPEGCLYPNAAPVDDVDLCTLKKQATTDTAIAVWGDSHAAAFAPGIIAERVSSGTQVKLLAMQGCPPLMNISVAQTAHQRSDSCGHFNNIALKKVINDKHIDTVILIAYWSMYASGHRLPTDPNHGNAYLYDITTNDYLLDIENNTRVLQQGLTQTIRQLEKHGKQVIIFGPTPELAINGTASLARMKMLAHSHDSRLSRTDVIARLQPALTALSAVATAERVSIFYPHHYLCAADLCTIADNGGALYHDRHHLSVYGAHKLLGFFSKNSNQ